MDPVTTAIVAGIAAGATEIAKNAIVDAYGALKTIIKQKLGEKSELANAIESLENKPDSTGRKAMLQEEVTAAKADRDPEILAATQQLIDAIKDQPGGEKHIQTATGSYIAQADRGGTATVTVNQPKEQ